MRSPGSFVLAAAGLLDGRRATTHWKSCADFRALYPDVELHPNVLYTADDNVLTSAGVATGIDLCLHMIRATTARRSPTRSSAARRTPAPRRRSGPVHPAPDPRVAAVLHRSGQGMGAEEHQTPVSLREMAEQESMSRRTFVRRFREEVGISPMQWLTQQRVERPRELLEGTDLPIYRVAADASFGTAAALRQHLHVTIGVSPSAYRHTLGHSPDGATRGA